MATTKKTPRTETGGQDPRSQRREAAQAAQAAQARQEQRRRRLLVWSVGVVVVAVAAAMIVLGMRGSDDGETSGATGEAPVVGGDLHTIFSLDDALYVGGHAQVAVSSDEGASWQDVGGLAGADAMGWAATGDTLLVGGHPGLYRSTDVGSTFERLSGSSAVPDVHALGGNDDVLYLASTQAGVLASTDEGTSWEVRSAEAGRSFMGTILVDPQDSNRLIAPDMAGALAISSDGGRSWSELGGPMGAMAIAWNPADTDEIIAVGMQGAERTDDGGASWAPVQLPAGTAAVTYSPDGDTMYAAALSGQQAIVYRSTDDGGTWTLTT